MHIIIEINCDNDAFAKDADYEVARILSELAGKVARHLVDDGYSLMDVNGSKVGDYSAYE